MNIFKVKVWAKALSYGKSSGELQLVVTNNDGTVSDITITNPSREMIRRAEVAAGSSKSIEVILHVEESDLDEARRLLGVGKNTEAIAKALDIIERLDKK